MLVGPIKFSIVVSPVAGDPNLAIATITADRTDESPLENPHLFVQPSDLVIDHGSGRVSVSLSREEIRQGLGCVAIRIKDLSGQPLAEVTLVATVEEDGSISSRLEKTVHRTDDKPEKTRQTSRGRRAR